VLNTWLTEQLELDVPVVLAPMAGVAGGELAAAVTAAGGFGMVGWGAGPVDDLRTHLRTAAAAGRFGVGLLAWTLPHQAEAVDVVLESRPALVSISYGDYASHVDRVKSAGALFATQVGTLRDAHEALDAGADVLVARGGEAGGHGRNSVATLPLLQAVLDAYPEVPVLAAGGIATARGVAAVLAAGAAGAWVGTPFTACREALTKPAARDALVAAGFDDTIYTTVLDIGRGHPWPEEFGGRAITNGFAREWHGREAELRANPVRSDEPVVWAGQSVGFIAEQRPAADVLAELGRADQLLAEVCGRIYRG
jgi:nitronate monooxygenase